MGTGCGWLIALLLLARPALGHGEADWIERDKSLVDRQGMHCCGPADCRVATDGEVVDRLTGVSVGGRFTAWDRVGVHRSIDARWWICVRAGVLRCVFRPGRDM